MSNNFEYRRKIITGTLIEKDMIKMKLFGKLLLFAAIPAAVYLSVNSIARSWGPNIPEVEVIKLTLTQKNETIVPYSAVRQDDNGEYIYTLESGKAVKKYILTDAESDKGFLVKDGIEEGEILIIEPDNIKENGESVIPRAGKVTRE